MTYLLSFLFSGFVCAISQIVIEKTKLTPGHINTMLVIVGTILSGFKIYDVILDKFSSGASILIINFGYLLVNGASEGYNTYGFMGLFKGVLSLCGGGISFAIICAFVISLICKIKN